MIRMTGKTDKYIFDSKGVASLTTILVIVILILIVAVSITALSINESSSSSSQSNTVAAQEYAEAGARDALQKLADNYQYSATPTPYTIPFVNNGCSTTPHTGCATVSVVNGTGYGTTSTPIAIISTGAVGNNSIEIQVNVILDQPNEYGQIATTTWQEISQ